MKDKITLHLKIDLKQEFWASDIYTLFMLVAYSILAIILYPFLNNSAELLLENVLIMIGILALILIESKFKSIKIIDLIRKLYIVPLIFFIYTQVQYYVRVVNPYFYDEFLVACDYFIFGVNPTQFLFQFSFPLLTEWLQISYLLYLFMPLAQGIELHFKRRTDRFKEFAAILLFGYYISYLLYFLLPAIGPRFILHEFTSISTELPGILFTEHIRDFIDSNATIFPGLPSNSETINRDCMPSGHTIITLLNMILAFRYKSIFKWSFLVIGTSLFFSTIYLRYHYVVDILAGFVLAIVFLWLEPKLRNQLMKWGFTNVK